MPHRLQIRDPLPARPRRRGPPARCLHRCASAAAREGRPRWSKVGVRREGGPAAAPAAARRGRSCTRRPVAPWSPSLPLLRWLGMGIRRCGGEASRRAAVSCRSCFWPSCRSPVVGPSTAALLSPAGFLLSLGRFGPCELGGIPC